MGACFSGLVFFPSRMPRGKWPAATGRNVVVAAVAFAVSGCTTHTPTPSAPEARMPTPGTVTRNNPAGDADSPVDAALTRLLEEPIGHKTDKFRTYEAMFADASHWKRVRFWGYPSRAGFRYGKDNYAVSVMLYEPSDDDDPNACLTAFAKKALHTARLFDVKTGPVERLERTHERGVEALDLTALIAEEVEIDRKRRARRMERRRREAARRARAEARRLPKRSAARETKPAGDGGTSKVGGANENASAAPVSDTDAAPPPPPRTAPSSPASAPSSRRPSRPRRGGFAGILERMLQKKRNPGGDDGDRKDEEKHPAHRAHTKRRVQALNEAMMPVLLTSGGFRTLTNDDQYLAALVAHPSWPGSCLVQGLAVKIGTDRDLAERALERWLQEAAGRSHWRWDLREQPSFDTR
ncbi:MAG: hypothetical protein AAGN82_11740 [Myxococcota bacterium]